MIIYQRNQTTEQLPNPSKSQLITDNEFTEKQKCNVDAHCLFSLTCAVVSELVKI